MRDPRYPSHQDVMAAILGWASNGKPYSAQDVRNGIADALGVTPELQKKRFRSGSAMTKWANYVAHGLSWHSRSPEAHILGEDGHYRLTERGKILASQLVDKK